ncbi:MAG: B12-binding domain-containing radical SAM protein [Promethearchaeota archaeon]
MVYFKNIILVKAECDYFDASFFEANIPLCYLSAVIKDHVNYVNMPIDMRIDLKPYEKFEDYLIQMENEGRNCDLVGISTMTASFPNAILFAKIAKKYGAYVVVGGYHPSALPEAMFDVLEIDAVVRGEGEMTFKELVLNGPSTLINGLSFRDENENIYHNQNRERIMDLDILPFPDRSLRPENPIFNKHEVVVTSRGCNGVCTFCANDSVHGRWRGRSPENVVAELKMLRKEHPDLSTIHIWDANFMQDSERVSKIIDLIEEYNIYFNYFCEMRVDHITKSPDLIKRLAEIGMEWIAIGIESPNQDRLKKLKKGITTYAVEKAIEILKQNKIKVVGYLMIGDPEETMEQVKEYPVYATRLGIDKIMLAIQTPHPGSLLFKEMTKEGTITSYQWEKYDIGHSVAKLEHMTNEECEVLMDWCWGKYYSPEWAFSRERTIKGAFYQYLAFVWIGYPGYLIHARSSETVEDNLRAYISAMQGYYDLSKFELTDTEYLGDLRGFDFQLTFQFNNGDDISLLVSIDNRKKLVIEIFNGKRSDVFLDFTIKSSDFINILRSLPLQIISLVHWGGFNFSNLKANVHIFKTFLSILIKAIRLNTINYSELSKFLVAFTKFLPKTFYEQIREEIQIFNNKKKSKLYEDNEMKVLTNSVRYVLYKIMMFPFTALVPVD